MKSATSGLPRPPFPGIVPSPTTCTPLSSKTDEPGREEMVHGVYHNDDEPPALNSCLARVRHHVTSPSRSSLVAPPPPLKRQPRGRGAAPKARSYPGTDCDRQLPGSLVFQRTGRGGRSVTSGSGSGPFLPPPPQGRSSHSLLWLASGRTSGLGRRVPGGSGLLPFSGRRRCESGACLPLC